MKSDDVEKGAAAGKDQKKSRILKNVVQDDHGQDNDGQ